MYYALFDSQGNRLASYHPDIHTNIPADAIEISDADQSFYATNEYIRGTDGKPQKKPAYVATQSEMDAQHNEQIKADIALLEEKQHRAIREVVLAKPELLNQTNESVLKLQDIDAQITNLRAELK